MALDAGLFEPGMGQPGYGQDISISVEAGSAEANRITAGLIDGSLIGDGKGGVMESGIAPTLTPEPADPFDGSRQEEYDAFLSTDDGAFDYTQTDGQWDDLRGTSRSSPYGPNTGNQDSEYIAWYNPHGGQTFIGVRPDGTKQIIDQSTAVSLGYEAPDIMGGPPGGPWDQVITPGETYNPDGGGGGGGGYGPGYDDEGNPIPYPGGGGGGGGGDPWDPGGPAGGAPPGPVGSGGLPQPGEPGIVLPGDQTPADTSWNWDAFQPKSPGAGEWGGYDTDYQAFERYQPGMDSPWGMPDVEGGNKDFYQQQFVNLLRDDQGYRNRARGAQAAYQNAQDTPYEAPAMDWSWANAGEGLANVDLLPSGYASPLEGFVPGSGYSTEQPTSYFNPITQKQTPYPGRGGGNGAAGEL